MTSMRNRQTRTITQALVVFLFKLRTGNSNVSLASILQDSNLLENEQLCFGIFINNSQVISGRRVAFSF